MARFKLSNYGGYSDLQKKFTILIITDCILFKPRNIFSHFIRDKYVPIKAAINSIKSWEQEGAEIVYLTSRTDLRHVRKIKAVLNKHKFPGTFIYSRSEGQKYSDLILDLALPNIVIGGNRIEKGGLWLMHIDYEKPELKENIKAIAIKEFDNWRETKRL